MNMVIVKWFTGMEFWFALVKVPAIVAFLVVGMVFPGRGKALNGHTTGFYLITDNGGLFPHGLQQGVVFAFAAVELVGTAAGECVSGGASLFVWLFSWLGCLMPEASWTWRRSR